jgi:hypothetical protein
MVQGILDDVIATDYIIYLTGNTNYRTEIAVTQPYKGNRPERKPVHFKEAREYLKSVFKATVTIDEEADDAMGIEAMNSFMPTVIATLDKDLDMIPGPHYNWRTGRMYNMTTLESLRCFYKQLLMGDTTDNIRGIKNIGPKTAEKLLNNCKNEDEMFSVVLNTYYQHIWNTKNSVGLSETDEEFREICMEIAKRRIQENGILLWIRRKEGEMWKLPQLK